VTKPRNDLSSPVPKFCLGLEASRRTAEGKVRTAHELVAHFFPHTEGGSTDRLFHFLPADVRGPILTSWGVRGQKSALRDSDEKVRNVVHDALVAGDVDAPMFESSLAPEVLVRWIDLPDWWAFWRGGKLAKYSILKALETAYELGLFDADWFLITVGSKDGKTRGTDLLSEGLSKADLTEWLRAIYLTADGSPRGIVAALGWDQIVSKTPDDVLIAVLDAIAIKVGLRENPKTAKKADPPAAAPEVAKAVPAEAPKAAPVEVAKAPATVEAPKPAPAEVKAAPPDHDEEAPRAPLETWTPAAPSVAEDGDDEEEEEEEDDDDARPDPSPANLKQAAVPAVARASEATAETKPKDAARLSTPDAKPPTRKLPAIFIPSSARMNDSGEARPSTPAPVPAVMRAQAPSDPGGNLFKDEEIPISADAFDDLGDGQKPVTPRPPETTSRKRPSKAPQGNKG